MAKPKTATEESAAHLLEPRAVAIAAVVSRTSFDPEIINLSAAISLKRIADALERGVEIAEGPTGRMGITP